jgi:hypothetical protein
MFAIVPIHQNEGSISLHFRWMFRRWDCILIEVTYAVIPGTGTVQYIGSVPIEATVVEGKNYSQKWKK